MTTLGTDGWWRTVPLQSFDDDTALDQLAQELEETPSPDGLGAAPPHPAPLPRGERESRGAPGEGGKRQPRSEVPAPAGPCAGRPAAVRLSLLERVARSGGGNAFRLHPLLAELGRARARNDPVIDRMTGWFLERLPAGGEDQGRRWGEVHDETAVLIEWLPQVPAAERRQIVEAAMRYATRGGPFHAWLRFCEEALAEEQDKGARSNLMWVLVQVALRSGLLCLALADARRMRLPEAARIEAFLKSYSLSCD